jgi:hypothetical protein
MYDTVLTLQPGGNMMTGHGGLGNGLQTVVRDGAPINDPTPKTASVPSSQSGPESSKPQQGKLANTKGSQPDVAKRLATGHVVDVGALRSRQGNCSDITGTSGGSAPINCPPSNGVPPNVQSQINAAKSNQQLTNPQQPSLPNDGRTAAVEEAVQKLEEAKAALEAAGDLAVAANTAEQINVLRKRASCPALAPEEFWKGTENETTVRPRTAPRAEQRSTECSAALNTRLVNYCMTSATGSAKRLSPSSRLIRGLMKRSQTTCSTRRYPVTLTERPWACGTG